MPFGINESTLRRAYAPLDLSGIYNTVDVYQRTLTSENRARKQEAYRNYYTNLASINQERRGIRAADAADVSKLYRDWANAERQLANNPRMLQQNPEMYGRLKDESDRKYSELSTLMKGSKDLAKLEVDGYKQLLDPKNEGMFQDNAHDIWKQKVMNNRYFDVLNNGYDDITKYKEPVLDGSKFRADLSANLIPHGFEKNAVVSFIDDNGKTVVRKYNSLPNIASIQKVVENSLFKNYGDKKAEKYATQEISSLTPADIKNVKLVYDNYRNNVNKELFGKNAPIPPDLFANWEDMSNAQRLINIKTAESLANIDKNYKEEMSYEDKLKMQNKYQTNRMILQSSLIENRKPTETKGIKDLYSEIDTEAAKTANKKGGYNIRTVINLPADQQDVLLEIARNSTKTPYLNAKDINIQKVGDKLILSLQNNIYADDKNTKILYDAGEKITVLTKDYINKLANRGKVVSTIPESVVEPVAPKRESRAVAPKREGKEVVKDKKLIKGF